MECPSCNFHLTRCKYYGIDVDVCRNCSGTWFHPDGKMKACIKSLLKHRNDIPDAQMESHKEIMSIDHLSEPLKLCPHCNEPMIKINYAYDSNIILDKCTSCHAIWTDKEELHQLATYTKGNPQFETLGKAIMAQNRQSKRNTGGTACIMKYRWHFLFASSFTISTIALLKITLHIPPFSNDFTLGILLLLIGWIMAFTHTASVVGEKLWWLGGTFLWSIYPRLDAPGRKRMAKISTCLTGWAFIAISWVLMTANLWR